jgi:hypothetical protein
MRTKPFKQTHLEASSTNDRPAITGQRRLSTRLCPQSILFGGRIRCQHLKRVLNAVSQAALILLDRDDVVGIIGDDPLGDAALNPWSRSSPPLRSTPGVQQFRNGSDLASSRRIST